MRIASPITERELTEWAERAHENETWTSEDVLRLITEVQRLRDRLDPPVIRRDPDRRGGTPTIGGTRIAVHDVVSYARHYAGDLERVRREALPDLTLTELETAMAYYEKHREEIDEILSQRAEDYERSPVVPTRA